MRALPLSPPCAVAVRVSYPHRSRPPRVRIAVARAQRAVPASDAEEMPPRRLRAHAHLDGPRLLRQQPRVQVLRAPASRAARVTALRAAPLSAMRARALRGTPVPRRPRGAAMALAVRASSLSPMERRASHRVTVCTVCARRLPYAAEQARGVTVSCVGRTALALPAARLPSIMCRAVVARRGWPMARRASHQATVCIVRARRSYAVEQVRGQTAPRVGRGASASPAAHPLPTM